MVRQKNKREHEKPLILAADKRKREEKLSALMNQRKQLKEFQNKILDTHMQQIDKREEDYRTYV